jgi:transposase-like protein
MIRLFTTLCKSLLESFTDVAIFRDATEAFCHYGKKCPGCGAEKLSPYGSYSRNLVSYEDGATVESSVSPLRFECTSCGTTHALLPDILIPYSPYSLHFKLTVLVAYFERKMTVVAICQHFGVAVSTLYSWKKRLLEHKELLLGILASLEEPVIAFLRSLLGAACISDRLRSFFHRYSFSFMQNQSIKTTRSRPP